MTGIERRLRFQNRRNTKEEVELIANARRFQPLGFNKRVLKKIEGVELRAAKNAWFPKNLFYHVQLRTYAAAMSR